MQKYRKELKQPARTLRNNLTEAEQLLWYRVRRKQIHGAQFYRQKPLLSFIVDFYCPAARLVVELDGSQHAQTAYQGKDNARDSALGELGLQTLRFDNRQVLAETEAVLMVIEQAVRAGLKNPPLPPLFQRGERFLAT